MGRRLACLLLLSTLLTGCARVAPGVPGVPGATASGGGGPVGAEFARRAAHVAQAWSQTGLADASTLVPLQDLTLAPTAPFPDARTRDLFDRGVFRTAVRLTDSPSRGTVQYADGPRTVRVVGALTAFGQLRRAAPACFPPGPSLPHGSSCAWLTVTGARLGDARLLTAHGMATVPAWLFTVQGLAGPVTRVAVAPEAIRLPPPRTPQPGLPANPQLVDALDLLAVGGDTVRYRVAVGGCDSAPRPLLWESASTVVVGAWVKKKSTSGEPCPANLRLQPAEVVTRAPVGARTVLDGVTGQPLRLRVALG